MGSLSDSDAENVGLNNSTYAAPPKCGEWNLAGFCLYWVECSKMAHNKNYRVKQRISLTQTKFVKHFALDGKHVKPSKQRILAVVNNFLETGSVLDVPRSSRQKTGDQRLTLRQLAIGNTEKSKEVRLSVDFRQNKVKRSTAAVQNILQKDLKEAP